MLIILTNEETARANKQLIKWLSEIKGVPYMLAPRRPCLDYSKIYSDKVWREMIVSMEAKQTNYILHILYTNSKFSIDSVNKHN